MGKDVVVSIITLLEDFYPLFLKGSRLFHTYIAISSLLPLVNTC